MAFASGAGPVAWCERYFGAQSASFAFRTRRRRGQWPGALLGHSHGVFLWSLVAPGPRGLCVLRS
eukprot:99024-Alexandrium_andersonii.AAC.1